jgi:hypothetical protein
LIEQQRVRLQVAIALPESVRLELAQMARHERTTEAALIERAVEGLVNAERAPDVPQICAPAGADRSHTDAGRINKPTVGMLNSGLWLGP